MISLCHVALLLARSRFRRALRLWHAFEHCVLGPLRSELHCLKISPLGNDWHTAVQRAAVHRIPPYDSARCSPVQRGRSYPPTCSPFAVAKVSCASPIAVWCVNSFTVPASASNSHVVIRSPPSARQPGPCITVCSHTFRPRPDQRTKVRLHVMPQQKFRGDML